MEFRSVEKKDVLERMDEFCALHKVCFSARMDEEIVMHRYYENPCGDANVIFAEDKGKLIASCATLPTDIYCDGKIQKGSTWVNGMVLPEYSGKGLFQGLMNRLSQNRTDDDCIAGCSFPHYTSNRAHTHYLGWTNVYEIPTLQAVLPEQNDFAALDTSAVKTVYAKDIIWKPNAKICICKSPEYLKWRYQDNPTGDYKFVKTDDESWMVYKTYNDELNLIELHHNSQEGLKQLLYFAYKYCAENGYKKISAWAHINTEKHHILEKFGFRLSAPIRYFAVKQFSENINCDIFDWRNWELSMGDHNAY